MTARAAPLLLVTALIATAYAHAGERKLQRDPFARPSLLQSGERPAGDARRTVRAAPKVVPKPTFKLNAVLVAGRDSLANVNGVMVRIGESVDGYQLLEVHDRSAIFEKNKQRLTVDMALPEKAAQPFAPRVVPAAVGSDAK